MHRDVLRDAETCSRQEYSGRNAAYWSVLREERRAAVDRPSHTRGLPSNPGTPRYNRRTAGRGARGLLKSRSPTRRRGVRKRTGRLRRRTTRTRGVGVAARALVQRASKINPTEFQRPAGDVWGAPQRLLQTGRRTRPRTHRALRACPVTDTYSKKKNKMSCGYALQTTPSVPRVYASYVGPVSLALPRDPVSGDLVLELECTVRGENFLCKIVDARDYPNRDLTTASLNELVGLPSARLPEDLNSTAFKLGLQFVARLRELDKLQPDPREQRLDAQLQYPANVALWCNKLCGASSPAEIQPSSIQQAEQLYSTCCTANSGIDVLFNIEFFLQYLAEEFQQVGINKDRVLVAVVNIPNLDNAFFTHQRFMCYGSGASVFRSLVAPDISFHELCHGLTQTLNGLVYEGESGALNESFSDILAAAAEWKLYDTYPELKGEADWDIGEDSTRRRKKLRSMEHPDQGLQPQPSTYGGRFWVDPNNLGVDHGGVHINSGVGNRLFVLVAQYYNNDIQRAARLFFQAFKALPPRARYNHLTIQLLGLDNSLQNVLAAVNLLPSNGPVTPTPQPPQHHYNPLPQYYPRLPQLPPRYQELPQTPRWCPPPGWFPPPSWYNPSGGYPPRTVDAPEQVAWY